MVLLAHESSSAPVSPDQAFATRLAAAAGLTVAAVGLLVLTGWWLDIQVLTTPYGSISMKTNAAIGLLLCGTALWSFAHGLRTVGRGAAATGATIGALTLSQHVFGWDLGIDQLLFQEMPGAAATASPNRMGPNASTSLMLAGTSVLLLFAGTRRAVTWAQWMAVACTVLALLVIAGYIYGAIELYAIARYTGIAFHTAIALLVLHVGILSARIDEGPVAVFVADGPAGTLLRRLIGPIVLIPITLGYLILLGRDEDLFDRGLSYALFAVLVVVVLGTIVWQTAQRIAVADAQRRQAEADRQQLLRREQRARDEAERASRLKDQFIAVLSHELRTPLNVMLGWTQLLEQGHAPERQAHAAAVVARNGRLLVRLVEDLLDVSRMSAGQLDVSPRPMLFHAVVQNGLDALAPVAADKGVQIVAELDPSIGVIEGDPDRVQQIVWNLLSNAVKFTGAPGRVHVQTGLDGAAVTLVVRDTGIGFDATFAPQLFEPFRQADSSSARAHGGLGLGLSIARHLAELHGGSLNGTSAGHGHGATFTLRLPVMRLAAGVGPLMAGPAEHAET